MFTFLHECVARGGVLEVEELRDTYKGVEKLATIITDGMLLSHQRSTAGMNSFQHWLRSEPAQGK